MYSCLIRNEGTVYQATISRKVIKINDITEAELVSDNQLGISAGTGFEYRLDIRHSLFLEFRFNKLFGLNHDSSFNTYGFQVISGISF
jgi:hypothetical protein